jgi:hypothetical protein
MITRQNAKENAAPAPTQVKAVDGMITRRRAKIMNVVIGGQLYMPLL